MKKILLGLIAFGLVCSIPKVSIADRPTDFYTTVTKTDNKSAAQTDTTLWTPASGKRIILQGVVVSTNAANNVDLEVSDVDVVPPLYLAANGGGVIQSGGAPIWIGATDASLTYTTSAATNVSVLAWGYEEEF